MTAPDEVSSTTQGRNYHRRMARRRGYETAWPATSDDAVSKSRRVLG
jgi:hypothetical protein